MKTILAVDPGTTQSAFAMMRGMELLHFNKIDNTYLRDTINDFREHCDHLAIEMVASYGMPVGRDVFETVFWTGRLTEAFRGPFTKVYRRQVKMHLCGSMRAKDGNIRQAIIDMYEPSGGGKTPQIGIKRKPGPLFGVKADIWAAIGVGLTYQGIS